MEQKKLSPAKVSPSPPLCTPPTSTLSSSDKTSNNTYQGGRGGPCPLIQHDSSHRHDPIALAAHRPDLPLLLGHPLCPVRPLNHHSRSPRPLPPPLLRLPRPLPRPPEQRPHTLLPQLTHPDTLAQKATAEKEPHTTHPTPQIPVVCKSRGQRYRPRLRRRGWLEVPRVGRRRGRVDGHESKFGTAGQSCGREETSSALRHG